MEEIGKLGFLQQVTQSGIYLTAHLEALSRKHGLGERARQGPAAGARSEAQHRAGGRREAMEKGLLINAPRPDSLRFMPALNVTREEIDRMSGVLDEVLAAVG